MRTKSIELMETLSLSAEAKANAAAFESGDTVRVHAKVVEGDKERVQVFEGTCIRKKNAGLASTFTVRKESYGVGVERIFPVFSPRIEKIEKVASNEVRRARLYFLRKLQGKAARLRRIDAKR